MIRFKQLDVWKEAEELALLTYRITELFPKSETFGLISQMQRAAVSVASNIVEGNTKRNLLISLSFAWGTLRASDTCRNRQ